jgi:hypothetical protein
MMTHDPFQNYQTIGAYSGGATPFGLPYTAFHPYLNPLAVGGQPFANPGIGGGYGIYPQPLQGLGITGQQGPFQQLLGVNPLVAALQQVPFQQLLGVNPLAALQNPWLQHALTQSVWQNPVLTASLQNPLLNPILAHQAWLQQQPQFNYPLAPQSLIGAGGIGQPFGQIHPLAQLGLRPTTGYGISPLAGCF